MTQKKTLQELEAYHQRLVVDVQRVKAVDPLGLNRNSPLIKNLTRCEEEIREARKAQ